MKLPALNRRGFLGTLAAAAVAPFAPKIAPPAVVTLTKTSAMAMTLPAPLYFTVTCRDIGDLEGARIAGTDIVIGKRID